MPTTNIETVIRKYKLYKQAEIDGSTFEVVDRKFVAFQRSVQRMYGYTMNAYELAACEKDITSLVGY